MVLLGDSSYLSCLNGSKYSAPTTTTDITLLVALASLPIVPLSECLNANVVFDLVFTEKTMR
jgi:hypothetical protein